MAGKQHKPKRFSILKIVCLVILCSVIGGAIVYSLSGRIRGLAQGARASGLIRLPEHTAKSAEAELAKMKRSQLEGEVQRLREEVTTRERENSEMKIQLKLLQEGSRTRKK